MPDRYDPDFIGDGIRIPLPTFQPSLAHAVLRRPDLRDDVFSDHLNFTLAMNEHTKQLVYSAFNMDQQKLRNLGSDFGKKSWGFPKDIGKENQVGNNFYKDRPESDGSKIYNPYDRGHMVMRHNAMWGTTDTQADKAGKATYIYANASLQHMNLNRGAWFDLETEVVRAFADDANGKLAVFTGPIYGDLDRSVHLSYTQSARIPAGFFKIIAYRSKSSDADKKLGVKAFVIFQDAQFLRDKSGAATIKTDQRYQFTVSEIQDMTGINFGPLLFGRNPLVAREETAAEFGVDDFPERIPVGTMQDVIAEYPDARRGIQGLPDRSIVLHAAMINPIGSETANEWVALFNRSGDAIPVDGWRLVDGQGRSGTLAGTVQPGDTLRVEGDMRGTIRLANTGGSLMLYDADEKIVDHATWSAQDVKRVKEGVAFMFERGQ
ncbi:MAG: DNA/RNA non-specific endonuclease [Pseudomonadota bacterium]